MQRAPLTLSFARRIALRSCATLHRRAFAHTSATSNAAAPRGAFQIDSLGEPFERRGLRQPVWVDAPGEALSAVLRSGCTVFAHSAAACPTPLLAAMTAVGVANGLSDIEVMHMHIDGAAPHMEPGMERVFRDTSFFVGANARAAIAAGRADYVPIFLSEIPLLFRRGVKPVDVALINISPPDARGYCSLGPSVDITRAALQVRASVFVWHAW